MLCDNSRICADNSSYKSITTKLKLPGTNCEMTSKMLWCNLSFDRFRGLFALLDAIFFQFLFFALQVNDDRERCENKSTTPTQTTLVDFGFAATEFVFELADGIVGRWLKESVSVEEGTLRYVADKAYSKSTSDALRLQQVFCSFFDGVFHEGYWVLWSSNATTNGRDWLHGRAQSFNQYTHG